jgi:UDP-N-acetylmuramoylalanine--D-glutamate ligase
LRIAILGLGRSGLSAARAALARGDSAVVFDEKPAEALDKPGMLDAARRDGIRVEMAYRPTGDWFEIDGYSPDLVVLNPAVPGTHPGIVYAVERGIAVIGEIEYAYRISKAPIVAITGTNGKSTTTVMAYQALRGSGIDALLCGNIYGSGFPEATLTEAASTATHDQILVAEVSSYQLESVNSFRPKVAVITRIAPDHLDRHKSMEEYVAAKNKIFEYQTSDDFAVAHQPLGSGRRFTIGRDVRVDDEMLHVLDRQFERRSFPFREEHNYINGGVALLIVACIRAVRGLGLTIPDEAVEAIRGFKGLAHRMESLGERGGVEVINNSMSTNPDAVISSTSDFRQRVHLLVGGRNKNLDFRSVADFVAAAGHEVYLFGSDSQNLLEIFGQNASTYRTMQEAFKAATDSAKAGEVIMLAPGCASNDQFRDFVQRGDVFKAIAKEWLST